MFIIFTPGPAGRRRAAGACRVLGTVLVSLLFAGAVGAQELMPPTSTGWNGFSPRPESAPGLLAAADGAGYALEVHGNGVPNVYGGWRTRIQGVSGAQFYRFRAAAVPVEINSARESVTILLRWRGSYGDEVAPDYIWQHRLQNDGTLLFDRTLQSPPGTTSVDVELVLQWAPAGRVRFRGLSFVPASAPTPRSVKVAAVSFRPSGTTSGLDSVQRAARFGEGIAAANRPDVMVFGELLNVIGAPGTYDAKAETVPGPSTDVMAGLARMYGVYVAFGMLERQDRYLYNTAVLLDRNGALVGKYRKMQLPLAEVSVGLTPGSQVPVFQTDFGRVALLICQDAAFPEPAREAAVQGAELVLLPIWGGKPALTAARAIEHSMYVAASGYDYRSEIVDPLGTVIDRVSAPGESDAAVATLDLNRRFREEWSGDWRDVSNKERREAPYNADETTPDGGEPPPPPPTNVPPSVNISTPADGATFTAPATIALTASSSDSDGTVLRVDFYSGMTLLGSDTSSPYSFTWSAVQAGSYTFSARAIDDDGATTTSGFVNVTVAATPPPDPGLPSPWATGDIGPVGVAGMAAAAEGTFTVKGEGVDIWGSTDAFRYVWQPVNGDVDVVARVASMDYVHAWVKGGVMIRERLTADSPHALMLASPGKGLAFQRRTASAGASTSTSGGAGTAPVWVKLERRGNTIAAYYSWSGTDWTLVGADNFTMTSSVYVGLAVSSHVTGVLATAQFDNVSIRTVSALPHPWQSQDVGSVGVTGTASGAAGTFTVAGAGADVWGTADAFHYLWQPLSGDGDVIARVTAIEYVHDWVKAGVMIRQSLAPDAAHAFMLVSPGKGLRFQRRVGPGEISSSTSGAFVTAPMWVKLERRGQFISAFSSPDGANWTLVGTDTFTIGTDVYVGLAVSSHDIGRLATARFDSVSVSIK